MAVKTRRNESSSRDSNIKKGKLSMKRNKQKKKIAVLDSLTGEDALSLLYRGRPPLTQMRQFIEDRCPDYAPWALAHLKPRKRRAK